MSFGDPQLLEPRKENWCLFDLTKLYAQQYIYTQFLSNYSLISFKK